MAKIDVNEQIAKKFIEPLDYPHTRRIIVWHDADSSFADAFNGFIANPPISDRPVHVCNVDKMGAFELKRMINRQLANDDFLLYTTATKDLTAKALEQNWLADIWILAEHFQADFAYLLKDELNANEAALENIAKYKAFFNAQDRREKFKKVIPAASSGTEVLLGIFAVLLNAEEPSVACLVRCYLEHLYSEDSAVETFEKYDVDAVWGKFLIDGIGFAGNAKSLDELAGHVLISALCAQLPDNSLGSLSKKITPPQGQHCINIVHNWMDSTKETDALYNVSREIENRVNLPQLLSQLNLSEIVEADVFPCINEAILQNLCHNLANGVDQVDEARIICQRRKDLRWYSRVSDYFNALNFAIDVQAFGRAHAKGFHLSLPTEIWKAYTSDWFNMDTAYRQFCVAYDTAQISNNEIPDGLRDDFDALAIWVERAYVNWYLCETNACWVNASAEQWAETGHIEGIPLQTRFYDENITLSSGGTKKIMVIISDALRYEVAFELATRLESNTSGLADITSMQGIFPTITEFGMAALLPHSSINYNMESNAVMLDGTKATATCSQRENALQQHTKKGRCVQASKLLVAKRAERRDLISDAEIVYVYHNTIDATGETQSKEHSVFKACNDAIEELVALVKMATTDLNFSRILITADHGFLYTRDPLEEREKISAKEFVDSSAKIGRRYIVAKDKTPDDTLVKVNMENIHGGPFYGLAPRECIRIKRAGSGNNYVHGGVSLQECCVPVIHFRNIKSGSKNFEATTFATFKLLSSSRRITSMNFTLQLFQKECVGGKVLAEEYEIFMTDETGNEVTEIRKAHADMTIENETARTRRLQFSLKAGRTYSSSQIYYLVCRSKSTGIESWKQQFTIDIPFAPLDDFGF
jgi:uncharacterized protein (TIGR02687 family)